MRALGAILCAMALAGPAKAADIAVALTDDLVEVDAGFAGARLTLFGAVSGVADPARAVDIIAVISGPAARFEIRRVERKNFIWTPGDAHVIADAPGLYLTAATRPIMDIAPLPDQAVYRLGTDYLAFAAAARGRERAAEERFIDALIDHAREKGLYGDRVGGVSFKKGALFAINADLPANTPVGDYDVSVYLYQDGRLLGRDSAWLVVNKVGIERRIYELAYRRPVSYGVLCVVLALLAGWAASLAFRK